MKTSARIERHFSITKLCFSIILLVPFCPVFGQVSEQDKQDAVKQGKFFIQRLRRTQSIKPLLSEFFTPDFMPGIQRDSGHNALVFLELSNQKIDLTEAQRQRYYLASQNWFFLGWLYNCWRDPKSLGNDDVKIDDRPFPRGVKRLLERTSFRLLLHADEFDGANEADILKSFPKTVADFAALTRNLERINSLYRRSMGPLRRMPNHRFDAMLGKCEGGDFYSVEMASCNKSGDCPGVPKGVPLIGIRAPLFEFIDFARLDVRMKIVRLFLFNESLK